jgi:hypothetical protein
VRIGRAVSWRNGAGEPISAPRTVRSQQSTRGTSDCHERFYWIVRKSRQRKDSNRYERALHRTPPGARVPPRKLLKSALGIEMWQVEVARLRGQKRPAILYEVNAPGVGVTTFSWPREALEYFRTLTEGQSGHQTARPPR